MNLTTDKWIPVVWQNGKADKVSLLDVYQQGDQMRDLAVRPHERIALMRLLICVAQAALDGPKDHEDWKTCGKRLPQAAAKYLAKWKHAFELFGDGQRFLQMRGLGEATPVELEKLDFVDADMSALFSQESAPGREFPDDWIVFRLLTYQSFAAGGCCGGSEIVDGKKRPQKGTNGPCRDGSAFHCIVRKEDLGATVHANLLTKDQVTMMAPLAWGHPVWEFKTTAIKDIPENTPMTYLGRLVPVSRAIWVSSDHKTVLNANGLRYPSFSSDDLRLEPGLTVVLRKRLGKQVRAVLSAKKGESILHPWRELHSVLVLRQADIGGPKVLAQIGNEDVFDLWLGAFVTDQAKVLDGVEFVFTRLPGELVTDQNAQARYAEGIKSATGWESRMRKAIEYYALSLETAGEMPQLESTHLKLKRERRERIAKHATKSTAHFWTCLEGNSHVLVSSAVTADQAPWGKVLARAARDAYELACPHGTPRQLKAYALGLSALFRPVQVVATESATEETEE
jgi:CRISPR system Cascade subunit CasA